MYKPVKINFFAFVVLASTNLSYFTTSMAPHLSSPLSETKAKRPCTLIESRPLRRATVTPSIVLKSNSRKLIAFVSTPATALINRVVRASVINPVERKCTFSLVILCGWQNCEVKSWKEINAEMLEVFLWHGFKLRNALLSIYGWKLLELLYFFLLRFQLREYDLIFMNYLGWNNKDFFLKLFWYCFFMYLQCFQNFIIERKLFRCDPLILLQYIMYKIKY